MEEKCRLCGMNSENLTNIFQKHDHFPHLKLRICVNLQIRVSAIDKLSHSICLICLTKLEEFDRFIVKCQKTQFLLSNFEETAPLLIQEEEVTKIDVDCVLFDAESNTLPIEITDSIYHCNDDIKENENEMPFKKRKLSDEFEERFIDVEDEKQEGMKINDISNVNLACDLIQEVPEDAAVTIRKRPMNELVSFFPTRVQVNESTPINEDLNDITDQRIIDIDLKKDLEIVEIKEEMVDIDDSDRSDSLVDDLDANLNELDEKSDCDSVREVVKLKNVTKPLKIQSAKLRTCPLCGHQFVYNEIEEHVRFHSDDEDYIKIIIDEMNEIPFKHKTHYCEECKKVFVRDSLFIEHQKEHLKIKMINCHLCDHTFSIRKKLKVHLRAVHIPKNSKCDLCSYAAKSLADLQKHIKGVHEFQPMICEICGKSVSCNVSNYNRHLQTHSEDRPYKCDLCNSAYKTAASLQKHRHNIHFPKPVMCTDCGTICGSQLKYKKHVKRCRKRMLRFN